MPQDRQKTSITNCFWENNNKGTSAAEWPHDQRYVEMGAIMGDLAVMNDTAERCVKDIQDFDHRGNIVSGSHRVKLPSFLKNEMEEQL